MYVGKVGISLVVLAMFVVTYVSPVSACLSDDEVSFFQFFDSYYYNSTNQTVNSTMIFERMCETDHVLNGTKVGHSEIGGFYNSTEIDKQFAMIDWNISQLSTNETLQIVNASLNNMLFWEMDKIDDRFNNLKTDFNNTYVSYAYFEQFDSSMRGTMYDLEQAFYTKPPQEVIYMFAISAVAVFAIIAAIKVKPDLFRKGDLLKKLPKSPSKLHGLEDYAIPGDLTERTKNTRDLKYDVATDDSLTREEKLELMRKVEDGKIRNSNELSREIEIVNAMKPKPKRKRKGKGYGPEPQDTF